MPGKAGIVKFLIAVVLIQWAIILVQFWLLFKAGRENHALHDTIDEYKEQLTEL